MKGMRVFGLAVGLGAFLAASSGCGGKSAVKDDKNAAEVATAGDAAAGEPASTTETTVANPCAETANPCGGDMTMDEKKALANEVVAMFELVAAAIQDNAEDCIKMAAGVQKVADDNKELIARAKTLDEDPELKKWFDETHGEKMKVTMTGAMTAMMKKCAQDEGVRKAFTNLTGG